MYLFVEEMKIQSQNHKIITGVGPVALEHNKVEYKHYEHEHNRLL